MNIESFKTKLIRRRGELSARLRAIEADLATSRPDDDDRAVEREDEEVLESLGEQGLVELKAIRAALDRVERGQYGLCVACGEQIASERLEAVPHTPLCSRCAAEHGGKRARWPAWRTPSFGFMARRAPSPGPAMPWKQKAPW